MYTDDTEYDCVSCSDCKLEIIERKWTQLLLNWLNKCVHPKCPPVKELNSWSVVETINKYKEDIGVDEFDSDLLSCDDIEVFMRYKYPLLRLRYFYETKEVPKKMYLLNSILLYHCCVNSENGMVDSDICANLTKPEQEFILKFCERLTDMEVTVHNIELAIKDAYDSVKQPTSLKKPDQDRKPYKIKSDQSRPESNVQYSSPEMTVSSFDTSSSMAVDPSPTERTKNKRNPLKIKSVESETYEPTSLPEIPSSGFTSILTVESSPSESVKKKSNAKFKGVDSESDKPSLISEKTPIVTKLEVKTVIESPYLSPTSSSNLRVLDKPSKRELKTKLKVKSSAKEVEKSPKNLKQKLMLLKFKSSITVLPSAVTATSDASYSEIDYVVNDNSKSNFNEVKSRDAVSPYKMNVGDFGNVLSLERNKLGYSRHRCLDKCACSKCTPTGPSCADPGGSMEDCDKDKDYLLQSDFSEMQFLNCVSDKANCQYQQNYHCNFSLIDVKELVRRWERLGMQRSKFKRFLRNRKISLIMAVVVMLVIISIAIATVIFITVSRRSSTRSSKNRRMDELRLNNQKARIFQMNSYICKEGFCEKVYSPTSEYIYPSLSRCILLCMGPQLWPYPIGYTYFSRQVAVLATSKLEYKFQSIPSEAVNMYLAEAFKLFLGDLAKLERYNLDTMSTNISRDAMIKKMIIQIDIENDPDPRIRLETDESYTIKVETIVNQVIIKLLSASFCGMRHALETLSQLILLDQSSGNLITLTDMVIKDAPSYKYRGLMIDTGRNYIPVPDIMRTIDAMASVKLNTFHWRISDVTSFPLYLSAVPQLFEYGAYSRNLIYTKEDVKTVVRRAGIRGIRVLLEVAVPGPVGRAWSWMSENTCPSKNKNFTCNNVLCLRLGNKDTVYDILQILYSEILEMTKVDDVFHMSDGVFSLINCFYLLEDRDGFLEKSLDRLKLANKGFLPKLPIVWYTTHLMKDIEAQSWDRFGVQLTEWQPNPSEQFLSRFKVIHSSRWDLSCEATKQRCKRYRTWQDMYSWKSWKTLDVFSIVGGEAILWTDLVDTGNLDYHLWPRAAAVAERLWSDIALNGTVTSPVYVRLDSQRWRMVLKAIQVQPIWPLYCSFSPGVCLQKIKYKPIYFSVFYF